MSEHLLTDDIKKYINRELKPDELLKADDHLAECEACFGQIKDLRFAGKPAGFDFAQDWPEQSGHLSYEQLENYVDEKSDAVEREIADVHLQACADCKLRLEGLFEIKKLIEADLEKPGGALPPVEERPAWAGIRDFFLTGRYFLRFGFAALCLLVLVSLFTIVWMLWRDNSDDLAGLPNANLPQNNSAGTPNVNLQTDTLPNINSTPETNSNLTNQPTPELAAEKIPAQYRAEFERTLNSGRLNIPAEISGLRSQSGRLMSGGSDEIPFALSNPVGKIIQTNRPRFGWRKLEGAEGYIVNIYDADFNRVAGSPQISGNSWQIDKPLARNKTYLWQVTALKNGAEIKSPVRPAPDAKFKVLDAGHADELARLSRQYKNEHLFLGIMYAGAGLLDEAAREFQKELVKNPKSKTARKFLQEINAKKR